MGKLIQFPASRVRRSRHQAAADLFGAFGELKLVERAQLKFLAVCCAATLMLTTALQLASY
jgi:hypothetical protein